MSKAILLGDEAVALGAIHAGISAAYSYPGTPASEIMEYLIESSEEGRKFKASWSVNEKVAYEEALGVSFAGKRSMVSFKHVGLNVAADPFMNSAMTGANGGLVVVAADDPGMHSSQNEQDSRFFAQFAQVLCLEPSDHQEAYDMTRQAFDVSEMMGLPVLLRIVTRLSHSRSTVETREPRGQNELKYGDWKDWTLLPANARRRLSLLVEKQAGMREFAESSPFNALNLSAGNGSFGVIASGLGHNYLRECLKGPAAVPSVLKLGTYPIPEKLLARLVDRVDAILVVEEGYPLIEKSLKGFFGIRGKEIRGKTSGHLPPTGELSPDLVRRALGSQLPAAQPAARIRLAARPPQLCAGCPHADTLKALNKALEGHPAANVFSDIGCYTLGALPPYSAVKTCVCMGASVSMAKGGSDVGIRPSVAVLGDSTFAHSGITPLLGAAAENTDMTVIILDNAIVAMTGGQPSFGSGERLLRILEGVGVPGKHIRVIEPLPKNQEKNIQVIREEIAHPGLSVIVSARDCVQYSAKRRS